MTPQPSVRTPSNLPVVALVCSVVGFCLPPLLLVGMVLGIVALVQAKGGGYVLDGVPRTMEQARALYGIARELGMTADVALHLEVREPELVRRLLARAADQGRSDDTDEVIRRRLTLYDEVTHPILDWYGERGILVSVDAERPIEAVGRHILTALEVMQQMIADNPGVQRRAIDLTGLGKAFGATP